MGSLEKRKLEIEKAVKLLPAVREENLPVSMESNLPIVVTVKENNSLLSGAVKAIRKVIRKKK